MTDWCIHGSRCHTSIHEAGHAFAAAERGIPVIDVVIFQTSTKLEAAVTGDTAEGRVKIDMDSLRSLIANGTVSSVDLFDFAIAGKSAEFAVLGHETPGGAREDIRQFWGWTTGFSFTSIEQYERILGESLESAQQRMREWAQEREVSIVQLASLLLENGRLTGADVAAIIRNP